MLCAILCTGLVFFAVSFVLVLPASDAFRVSLAQSIQPRATTLVRGEAVAADLQRFAQIEGEADLAAVLKALPHWQNADGDLDTRAALADVARALGALARANASGR